jgi:archaellin
MQSLVLFAMVAVVALFAVTLMPASQQASAAAHHKVHTVSTQVSTTVAVHHKVHIASKGKISVHQVAVIPEAHGKPNIVLQNATAMKALTKGPYGETDVIGGMMSGGY